MSDTEDSIIDQDGIERVPMRTFAERAYLDYSMYVVLDRALPHIGDGLKPVQRRIVYAMSELGLGVQAKPKKSARTVGDVIGKFHPHGDSACYEAMVLMAQPFSYRYPLVDGQGNWGSPDDPKSFAAMRYTEAKLTAYASTLLEELGHGTADWVPNFDGTMNEPKVLPAQLPNLLLNGTTGIAVGMATDIPPHNLREVVAACIHLLNNPKADDAEVAKLLPGPDFPTEAEIITPRAELGQIFSTGNGQLRMRARWNREKGGDLVITDLPHQVSGNKILEQVAAQMRARKLPMVEDLRDESDHENPTRLVITPKSRRSDADALMSHLFATTDLERSYRVNLNVIGLDGRPAVRGVRELLLEWIKFRQQTVTRRLQHRLDRVEERLHVLDGLLVAYLNLDEVIHIIRTEDEPKKVLMKRFKISDIQADAILDLKLRHLMKLEEMKIRGEQDELSAERKSLQGLLKSKAKLKKLIISELESAAKKFGDDRRSPIVEREAAEAMDELALMPTESITVVLSQRGWIRSAKGHDIDAAALSYKSGDEYLDAAAGKSNQLLAIIDSTGRTYSVPAHNLPSARGQGEPLTGRLNPPAGATFTGLMLGDAGDRYVLGSRAGYGFTGKLGEMQTRNKAGKATLSLPKNKPPGVLNPLRVDDPDACWLAVATAEGRLLVFALAELPELSRGKGNKLINVKGEDHIVAWAAVPEGTSLVLSSGQRKLTLKFRDLEPFIGSRAQRGQKLPRGFQRVQAANVET